MEATIEKKNETTFYHKKNNLAKYAKREREKSYGHYY